MNTLTLHIQGMSCGHCLNAVNAALGGQPGVEVGSVQMGRAQLRYDPAVTGPRQIAAAVSAAGYEATPSTESATAPSDPSTEAPR